MVDALAGLEDEEEGEEGGEACGVEGACEDLGQDPFETNSHDAGQVEDGDGGEEGDEDDL